MLQSVGIWRTKQGMMTSEMGRYNLVKLTASAVLPVNRRGVTGSSDSLGYVVNYSYFCSRVDACCGSIEHGSVLSATSLTNLFTMRQEPTYEAAQVLSSALDGGHPAQAAKIVCPVCNLASTPSVSDVWGTLVPEHVCTGLPQRSTHSPVTPTPLTEIPMQPVAVHASEEDSGVATVEHIDYPFHDNNAPRHTAFHISPESRGEYTAPFRIPETGITAVNITTSNLHNVQPITPYPPTFSPSPPTTPHSDRGPSPPLSASPIEHVSSWNYSETHTSATETEPTQSLYTDITRLRVNSEGRGCRCSVIYWSMTFS